MVPSTLAAFQLPQHVTAALSAKLASLGRLFAFCRQKSPLAENRLIIYNSGCFSRPTTSRLSFDNPHRHHRRGPSRRCPDTAGRLGGLRGQADERGERVIWIDDRQADKLGAMRGPGESYGDVILRIAGRESVSRCAP